jgi:hypothetical protein
MTEQEHLSNVLDILEHRPALRIWPLNQNCRGALSKRQLNRVCRFGNHCDKLRTASRGRIKATSIALVVSEFYRHGHSSPRLQPMSIAPPLGWTYAHLSTSLDEQAG